MDGISGQLRSYGFQNGEVASHQVEPHQTVIEAGVSSLALALPVVRRRVDLRPLQLKLRLDIRSFVQRRVVLLRRRRVQKRYLHTRRNQPRQNLQQSFEFQELNEQS